MSISTRASIACHIEVCEVLDISEYHAKSFNMNATSFILFFIYVKFFPRLEGMGIVRLPCFGTRIGGMNLLLEGESKSQVDTPLALRCAAEFIGTFLQFFSVGYILSEFCNSSLYHLPFALMDFFGRFSHDLIYFFHCLRFQCPFRGCNIWWIVLGYFAAVLACLQISVRTFSWLVSHGPEILTSWTESKVKVGVGERCCRAAFFDVVVYYMTRSVLTYALAGLSGANFSPAVTLAWLSSNLLFFLLWTLVSDPCKELL